MIIFSPIVLLLLGVISGMLVVMGALLWRIALQQRELLKLRPFSLKVEEQNVRILRLEEENAENIARLKHLNFPLWQRREDGRMTYCNSVFASVIGVGEVQVTNPESGIQPELFPNACDIARQAIRTRQTAHMRRHVVIDGNRVLMEIVETPIEFEGGKKGTIGYAIDASELEVTQSALKQHLAVQNDLMESSSSAIAIYGADKRLKFYNKAFVQLWKLDERWLDTNPPYSQVLDSLRNKQKLPEQADFQAFRKEQTALFHELIEKHEEFYYLPDERVLHVIIIPHEHGGLLFSYEDVTDQIALERSYKTLTSVHQQTLEHLSEAIAVFGANGRLSLYNSAYANLWELSHALLRSEPHLKQVLEETRFLYPQQAAKEEWERYGLEIMESMEQRASKQLRLTLTDETVLQWQSTPLPDGSMLFSYLDITDSALVEASLRAEKAALEEADSIKSNFLANVSYELRSPLTSIIGFTQMLLRGEGNRRADKQKRYIEGIDESARRLNTLIDHTLDIASIDAGYVELVREDNDIISIAQISLQEMSQHVTSRKTINSTLHMDEDIPPLYSDKKRMKQIIGNILSYAQESIDERGNIDVKISYDESSAVFTVAITHDGKTVDPKEYESLFEQFYLRSHNSYYSTSLGLTVAKRLVEMHGGAIDMRSDAKDGTTITCFFPVTKKLSR